MNCREFQKELKSWLESRWLKELKEIEGISGKVSPEKTMSQSFFIHAKECKKCCALFEGTIFLINGKKLQKRPPQSLYTQIEKSIKKAQKEAAINKPIIKKLVSKLLLKEWWNSPKWITVPLTGLVISALLIILIFSFIRPVSNQENKNTVTIHLYFKAPGAKEVSVVGDWNGWDPSVDRMKDPDGDGIWEIEIRLHPGEEYQYQFIIDGTKWVPDPNAPIQLDDGFGSKNSILHI